MIMIKTFELQFLLDRRIPKVVIIYQSSGWHDLAPDPSKGQLNLSQTPEDLKGSGKRYTT